MKKDFFLIIASFLIATTFLSQTKKDSIINKESKLKLELRLGASISYFTESIGPFPDRGFDPWVRVSANSSLRVKYSLPNDFFLNSGIQYNTKGGNFRREDNDVILIGDQGSQNAYNVKIYRLDYLEIPVQISYNLRKLFDKNYNESALPVLLSAGFIAGFNVKSDLRENSFSAGRGTGLVEVDENYTSTPFDFAKSFVPSALLELSFVTYQSKVGDFLLHINYAQTLTEVYTIETLDGDNYNTKSGTFSITFGLNFK